VEIIHGNSHENHHHNLDCWFIHHFLVDKSPFLVDKSQFLVDKSPFFGGLIHHVLLVNKR